MWISRTLLFAIVAASGFAGFIGFAGFMLRSIRHRARAPYPMIWIIGSLVLASTGIALFVTGRVIVIEGHGADIVAHRYIVVGSSTAERHGEAVPLEFSDKDKMEETWLVNRSDATVRVLNMAYGNERLAAPNQSVAPGELLRIGQVENVGPDDRFAGEITSDRLGETVTWVTW